MTAERRTSGGAVIQGAGPVLLSAAAGHEVRLAVVGPGSLPWLPDQRNQAMALRGVGAVAVAECG
jgi:hypothetical protein